MKPTKPLTQAELEAGTNRLLTYTQAAELFGVGYHKIQRPAKRGDLPTYHLGDSRPYVMLADILELLQRPPTKRRTRS